MFLLKPEPDRTLYVRVLVFASKAAMYRHLPLQRKHAGCCTGLTIRSYKRRKRVRTLPIFAEVCFYRGALQMMAVTHEFFHATIAYGRRIGFTWSRLDDDDSVNAEEERLTYAHSNLCSQWMTRALKAGLYDDAPSVKAPTTRRTR